MNIFRLPGVLYMIIELVGRWVGGLWAVGSVG